MAPDLKESEVSRKKAALQETKSAFLKRKRNAEENHLSKRVLFPSLIGKVRRQRLRPWLINQINSGEIPGLIWIDKENMIFKIPWKHFGRPGVDMYLDALLFRR